MAFFDSKVEESGLFRKLVHIVGLFYASETCPQIFFLLAESLSLLARFGTFTHLVTFFASRLDCGQAVPDGLLLFLIVLLTCLNIDELRAFGILGIPHSLI